MLRAEKSIAAVTSNEVKSTSFNESYLPLPLPLNSAVFSVGIETP